MPDLTTALDPGTYATPVGAPSAISPGTNRGEAAFLGESTFDPVEYSYRIAQQHRKDREEKKRNVLDNIKLLDDNVVTKWSSDQINYFQPKLQAIKQETMDLMRAQNGQLTPIQQMQQKSKINALDNEAKANEAMFSEYQNQIKQLDTDTEGKFDRNVSKSRLAVWNDPMAFSESKKDIQENFGGNINKWRTANADKFRLEPSYSFEKHIGDITKDEPINKDYLKDEAGKIIQQKTKNGENIYFTTQKLTPTQIDNVTKRVWGENNWKADHAKEYAKKQVDDMFHITDGMVSIPIDISDEQKANMSYIMDFASGGKKGDFRGMNADEIKTALAKGYTALQIKLSRPDNVVPVGEGFAPQPAKPADWGKTFADKYTVATVPSKPFLGDYREYNKKYGTNYTAADFGGAKRPETSAYIAIEPKNKGADTESLQLDVNGKQVRPMGYKIQDGHVVAQISEKVEKKNVNPFKEPKIVDEVRDNVPVTGKNLANIAAHYGFSSVDDFKAFLEAEAKKQGIETQGTPAGNDNGKPKVDY